MSKMIIYFNSEMNKKLKKFYLLRKLFDTSMFNQLMIGGGDMGGRGVYFFNFAWFQEMFLPFPFSQYS